MTRTLLFLTLVLSGCTSQAPDESKAAVDTLEQLLIAIPQDWKRIYSLNTAKTRLVDFVRAEESADAWTTKLSVESYLSDDISGDPISLLMSEAQSDMNKCNFVQHFNIHAGFENGYPSAVRLFMCGENAFSGMGEIKLVKVISGNDYLYSIRILRRIEPFEVSNPDFSDKDIANWSLFLSRVSLCNNTEPHPCPTPGGS
ncbi:MAG: hypothetical protein VXA40_01870 [Gammaproteobacteria bacterium]